MARIVCGSLNWAWAKYGAALIACTHATCLTTSSASASSSNSSGSQERATSLAPCSFPDAQTLALDTARAKPARTSWFASKYSQVVTSDTIGKYANSSGSSERIGSPAAETAAMSNTPDA